MKEERSIWPSVLWLVGVIALALLIVTSGCTQNERARVWGGTETIQLNSGEKVLNITWKETDMWVFIQLPDGRKEFREYSTFGMMNGKINIVEK